MKDKRTLKPIDIIFGILAFITIFIFVLHYSSIFVNAESPDGKLPYIVPNHLSLNSFYSESHNSYVMGNSTVQSYLSDADNYLIVPVDIGAYPQPNGYTDYYFYVYIFKNCTVSSNIPDYKTFNYTTTSVTVTSSNYLRVIYQYWERQNTFYGISGQTYTNTNGYSLLGSHNTVTYNIGDFTSCYPVYNSTDILDLNNKVIFTSNMEQVFQPQTGHATQPDTSGNNINSDGHAQQPNTPTFPTMPTIVLDTTNVESLLESIFDLVKEFGDFVGECFSTFFSWLVLVIQNGLQSIINNLKNLMDNLYQNFVSLFEPIAQNIEYIVQPIDSTVIYDNISSTSLISNLTTIENSLTSFSNSFDSLSEPNSYVIPIHLEDLPTSYFGNLSTQYIDLGVINPVKNALRTFMWALTTYGLFITIVDSISGYINGGQDE